MRTISVAIAVLLGASVGAYAQPAPAPAPVSADELFRQGKQLMKEGRYVEACAKFESSERLESSIGAQLNLGDCRAKLGQTATARLLFLKAAASSRAAGDSEREAEANRQAALLEARLSYLTVSTTPETRALPTLTVNIDGGVLPLTALDVPLPVDPGEHTVTAAATKYTPWQGKVVIAIGQRTTNLAIPRLVAVAVVAPRPTNPGEADLVAQAVAAHAADVAQHGGAPAVAVAPSVAVAPPVAVAPAVSAPPVAADPGVAAPGVAADPSVAAPGVGAASGAAVAPDVVATPQVPEVLDPRWSSEIGNRPLVTPKGKIEIHNGLPIFAEQTYDGTTGLPTGTITNEAIGVGATYGVIDNLEIGADAMQVLGTGSNTALSFHAAYNVITAGPIDVVADASLAVVTTGMSGDGEKNAFTTLGLGVGLRYKINNMFSLFTGRNGAPTMPLPVDFFNQYQASIALDINQPIIIRVPVGFAVQATPNIYTSAAVTLAAFRLNDPTSAAFIGADAFSVSVGAYYSTRVFDVGLQIIDNLENAGNSYVAALAFRYYVH